MVSGAVEQTGVGRDGAARRGFASPALRLLDLGTVPWLQSQSIHHGVAHAFGPDSPDTLLVVRPDRPYISVGRHGLGAPLSPPAVARSGLPVVRRALGGGTVLITPEQTFFVFVVNRRRLPLPDPEAMRWCLSAGAAAYAALGVDAQMSGTTDLCSGGRKLCGSGAATIGEAAVFGGNVMTGFDVATFLDVLHYPSRATRELVAREMLAQMGSVHDCGGGRPTPDEVAAAVRDGVRSACGVELVPGELSVAEIESAKRSEHWLTRVPKPSIPASRTWWKVRTGSGVLRAALTRPRPAALLLTVRDRVIAEVVPDMPVDGTVLDQTARVLVGRSLDDPPSPAAWAASGLQSDAVLELSRWLRQAAHTVT